jgi:hypothetical protein
MDHQPRGPDAKGDDELTTGRQAAKQASSGRMRFEEKWMKKQGFRCSHPRFSDDGFQFTRNILHRCTFWRDCAELYSRFDDILRGECVGCVRKKNHSRLTQRVRREPVGYLWWYWTRLKATDRERSSTYTSGGPTGQQRPYW